MVSLDKNLTGQAESRALGAGCKWQR